LNHFSTTICINLQIISSVEKLQLKQLLIQHNLRFIRGLIIMSRFLLIALFSLCYSLTVQADIYKASNALSRGDYETAVTEFTKLAEKGDANAQANLGYMYYAGEGVPQDYEKAVYWYRKAATQGNKDAQYNLAVSYAFGEGVKQDLTEAAIWYRRAGEQDHVVSQYSLGISYAYGEGVPQDQIEAARWFKKAADQGYARAQVHLGSMYHTGEGVEQDYSEAVRWYRMAADRGDATAQYNLGAMYRSGKGVEQNYAQAKRWFRQSADQGYAAAQNELASLERSAAANVATRTIQAKPEIPIVKESIPEPTPEKTVEVKEEPVEEKVVVQETKPSVVEETTSTVTQTETSEKKPLFSVEKEGLLSLDDSQLDIAKAEVTPEIIEEPEAEETVSQTKQVTPIEPEEEAGIEVTQTIEVEDSSGIQKALGVPAPKETDDETEASEGFFSKLFSKKEEPDTGKAYLFDQEEIAAEYANDKYIEEINDESTAETKTTADISKEVTQVEEPIEEAVDESEAEIKTSNDVSNEIAQTDKETEKSEGFFNKLFSKKEEPDTGKAYLFDQEVIAAEYANDKYIEKTEVIETEPEEIAEVTESTSNNNAIHNALGLPAPNETDEDTEATEGFFNKLFETKESTETEGEIAEVIDEEAVEEVIEEQEPNIVETPVYQEEIVALEAEEVKEEKDGFFSRLFSSKEETDKELTESDEIVAEVIEEEPVSESDLQDAIEFEEEVVKIEPNVIEAKGNNDEIAEKEIVIVEEVVSVEEAVISEQPATTENNWAESEQELSNNEEAESSEGLFSAIGNFFSGNDKSNNDDAINEQAIENEDEEVIIAKVEEPSPAVEENELADVAEPKLEEFSVQAARRALTNNDYDEAFRQFQPLAEAGDSEAQSHLGSLYYVGKGAPKDLKLAYNWYKKSADQGNVDAQYSIGNMYLLGEGVEQSNSEAAKWYTLAGNQGHRAANNNLSNLEKLEALNRENQLKLDAISAEQQKKDTKESLTEINQAPEVVDEIEESTVTPEIASIEEETIDYVQTNNDSEPSESKSPGFFESLFGSKDETSTDKVDNVTLEAAEEIESIDEEVINTDESIVANIEEETPEEIIIDVDTQSVTASTDEDTDKDKESGGLFGFLGGVFSSENEVESTEDVAMLEEDTEQVTESIDETIDDEISEVAAEISEFETTQALAIQGDQEAQFKLGSLYYSGNEVKQDYTQAALWYRRAAQQGNVDAQYSLGNMFLMGEGIGQDDSQAAQWYAMAAEQGHSSAKHNLENLQKTYESIEPEIETESTNSGQLISLDETPSATVSIEDTTGQSEYERGLAYAFGDGVPQNDRTAFNLFYESAKKGYALAQYKVGVAFAYGEGVRQDMKKAVEWYRKAAEQGHTIAQRNIATMYLDGNGVEQNKVQALAWYQVVANAGNAMDLRRRDMLKSELSEVELSESQRLAEQISVRITNPSL
jgi:TPR repeat protein